LELVATKWLSKNGMVTLWQRMPTLSKAPVAGSTVINERLADAVTQVEAIKCESILPALDRVEGKSFRPLGTKAAR
jgi:hypothetical protein